MTENRRDIWLPYRGPASGVSGITFRDGEVALVEDERALKQGDGSTAGGAGYVHGVPYGTAFPGSPTPMEQAYFYRTDLAESFFYDAVRTKWLSHAILAFQLGSLSATATLLTPFGSASSGTFGHMADWPMTCVGASAIAATSNSLSVRPQKNGTAFVLLTFPAATKVRNMALNTDFALGDTFNAIVTGGTLADCIVTGYFRRHES